MRDETRLLLLLLLLLLRARFERNVCEPVVEGEMFLVGVHAGSLF